MFATLKPESLTDSVYVANQVGGSNAPQCTVANGARVYCAYTGPRMSSTRPHNHLLASMAAGDFARWLPHLALAELPRGQVLHEPGAAPDAVYFPETALVSLQHVLTGGACAEVALVGRDGLVGLTSVMLDGARPCRAVVRSAGAAWRLAVRELRASCARSCPGARPCCT